MTASVETKKKWIMGMQLAATMAGAIVVILLRLHGVRFFFEYLPTFVLAWVPLFAGTFAIAKLDHATRGRWIAWGIGLALMIFATAYAAVGETPSAVLMR
ncbi:MAG: hypothetical protein ACRELY_16855 [Polyangiaceae bacterium]